MACLQSNHPLTCEDLTSRNSVEPSLQLGVCFVFTNLASS